MAVMETHQPVQSSLCSATARRLNKVPPLTKVFTALFTDQAVRVIPGISIGPMSPFTEVRACEGLKAGIMSFQEYGLLA